MKFFELFPTPEFLSLAEAGVSISDGAIRFISLKSAGMGEKTVSSYGEVRLPEEAIEAGAVGDKAALVSALLKLKSEHGITYVRASLPEEKSYLFTTTVDRVAYKDLHDAVAFTIEENVPVPLANSLFALDIIERPEAVKASVSVLPLDVAKAYEEVFNEAGLTPVSFDIEPLACARALVSETDARSHLIVNLGTRKIGFYVVEEGVVQFSSTLSLDTRSPEAVGTLKAEIRKLFIFWNTRIEGDAPGKPVERVIISGVLARDETLTSNMMSDVEVPYVLANVWANVCPLERHLPAMPFDESLSYAAAIGAALPLSKHSYV